MQQPIRLLMCSKLSKPINIPPSRDGLAHMGLCFAELVPKTCREAAIRNYDFANKYHHVTVLVLVHQDKGQHQRHAPRQTGVLETSVTRAHLCSQTYFGLPSQGSELSWKTGHNWTSFKYPFSFPEQQESWMRFSVPHKQLLWGLKIKQEKPPNQYLKVTVIGGDQTLLLS